MSDTHVEISDTNRRDTDIAMALLEDYHIKRVAVDALEAHSAGESDIYTYHPVKVADIIVYHIGCNVLPYLFGRGKTEMISRKRVLEVNQIGYISFDILSGVYDLIENTPRLSNPNDHLHYGMHQTRDGNNLCTSDKDDKEWIFMDTIVENSEELVIAIGNFIHPSKNDDIEEFDDISSIDESYEDIVVDLGKERREELGLAFNTRWEDLLTGVAELIRANAYLGDLQGRPEQDVDLREDLIEFSDNVKKLIEALQIQIKKGNVASTTKNIDDIFDQLDIDRADANLDDFSIDEDTDWNE